MAKSHHLLLLPLAVLVPRAADASCARRDSVDVKLDVTTCKAVKHGGILVKGTEGTKAYTVWIPAREKLTCAAVKPAAVVAGTIDYACCDGEPDPPCNLGTSSVLGKAKVAKPAAKPTKK